MLEKEKKTTQDSGGHKKHHKYLKNYHIKKEFRFHLNISREENEG